MFGGSEFSAVRGAGFRLVMVVAAASSAREPDLGLRVLGLGFKEASTL